MRLNEITRTVWDIMKVWVQLSIDGNEKWDKFRDGLMKNEACEQKWNRWGFISFYKLFSHEKRNFLAYHKKDRVGRRL